eukprot:2282403-Amphidinium_carterae.1
MLNGFQFLQLRIKGCEVFGQLYEGRLQRNYTWSDHTETSSCVPPPGPEGYEPPTPVVRRSGEEDSGCKFMQHVVRGSRCDVAGNVKGNIQVLYSALLSRAQVFEVTCPL